MTPPTTVLTRFDAMAVAHPRKVAVYWGRDHIAYAALRENIDSFAVGLQEHGIRPGDRVGILLKNCPEYIYSLYAALKLGATVVPVNSFLKAPEIRYIVDDCRIALLVTSADFDEVLGQLAGIRTVAVDELGRGRPAARPSSWPAIDPSSQALLIYTSGTTGKPKGAMLSHGNIAANVASCLEMLEESENDRLTLLLPMFHSFMLTVCIFTPLSIGASIVLIRSLHPLRAAMREIVMNRATIFLGIPQIFQALAQTKIPFWMHWVLNVRVAISGAAPLARETHEAFERKMRFPLIEGYGLSEASPAVSFNPIHGVRKPGSVGLPLPGIEVRIVDDHGHELAAGDVGEIVVRGPNVMQGYWNQPEETAAALKDGWLQTGDMGRKDGDGYLYIVDRRKELILVRGMNVYPREIEEVLYQYPRVQEAAVIGRPDEKRGEVPVAFVVPSEGAQLNAEDIQRHLRERLADYKLPRELRIVHSLPHTATGKISKRDLKQEVISGTARSPAR